MKFIAFGGRLVAVDANVIPHTQSQTQVELLVLKVLRGV